MGRRRQPKAEYALRFHAKRRGHACTKECEGLDLTQCYETRYLKLGTRTLKGARETASVLKGRGTIEGDDFTLVRILTPREQLAGADEWSEPVADPEHRESCRQISDGSARPSLVRGVQTGNLFWVCGPRCPTILGRKR